VVLDGGAEDKGEEDETGERLSLSLSLSLSLRFCLSSLPLRLV